jgi:hypothetical protein
MTGKMEATEIFVDGIGTMVFLGGLVRADLVRLVPDSNNPEKPSIKVVQKILISPQGFLQALGAMTELANKLKSSGVFQQKEEGEGTTTTK